LRAPAIKKRQRAAPPALSARLATHVALETQPDGNLVASFMGQSVGLGKFSADAANRAQALRAGLQIASFVSDRDDTEKEIHALVRRLAGNGLLEYRFGPRGGEDQVVIEPQVPDYWPRTPPFGNDDILVLSRFAYLRRRGNEMVLESPRAGGLFRISDPKVVAALAALASPQPIKRFRRHDGFPGLELLALLVDCQILFKVDPARDVGFRAAEGDDNLMLWDFHDLLFHTRSTEGRHANPVGGHYPYAGVMVPLPAVRSPWPGRKIDLHKFEAADSPAISPTAGLLRERHSTREFDGGRPVTLAELARFLACTARVQLKWQGPIDGEDGGPVVEYADRPYPSGGSSYELELYLAVDKCEGLARGFYHYDADGHALAEIEVPARELDALLMASEFAMGAPTVPQILITIAARFGRISWKYSSVAYSLILKDVGVLIQTFYLMATDMGLGGCSIGSTNIELFAKMTGLDFHVEGPVGQFAFGRGVPESKA
jgi:SagB-type dehydrogenase family enzyme